MRLSRTALSLFLVHLLTTIFRAARTFDFRAVIVQVVIERQFFARHYRASADKKYPFARNHRIKIRIAAMIDKLRAAPTDCAVNCPGFVEPKDIQMLPDASAP